MPTYDPKKTIVMINGKALTGWAKDSKIKVERDEDSVTKVVSVDGEVEYTENANVSGKATLSLDQYSASLPVIRQLEAQKEEFTLMINDTSGDEAVAVNSDRCRIAKLPSMERGKERATVEVVIEVPKVEPR